MSRFKAIGIGLLCIVLVGYSVHHLHAWYSTGKLWATFKGYPYSARYITFDSDPITFAVNAVCHLLIIACGSIGGFAALINRKLTPRAARRQA
jgi:hypothetical protein